MRGNALKDTTTINSMYNVKQNSDKKVKGSDRTSNNII